MVMMIVATDQTSLWQIFTATSAHVMQPSSNVKTRHGVCSCRTCVMGTMTAEMLPTNTLKKAASTKRVNQVSLGNAKALDPVECHWSTIDATNLRTVTSKQTK